MMTCKQFRHLCSPALDGRLIDEQQTLFQDHLHSCAACREHYRQLQLVCEGLARLSRRPQLPPEEMDRAVRSLWHPVLRPNPIFRSQQEPETWRAHLFIFRSVGALLGGIFAILSLLVLVSPTLPAFRKQLEAMITISLPHSNPAEMASRAYLRQMQEEEELDWEQTFLSDQETLASARIDGPSLDNFASRELQAGEEDSFAVVTLQNANGRSYIEGVLKSPRDRALVGEFGLLLLNSSFDMRSTPARWPTRVVWAFSRIMVSS